MEKKTYKHKVHFCIFCKKEVDRINVHFIRRHKYEERVKEIQRMEDKRKRFWGWKRLTQEGDFYFNNSMKDTNEKKKNVTAPREYSKSKKYFDCLLCKGRIRVISRRQHLRLCQKFLKGNEQRSLQVPENWEAPTEKDDCLSGLSETKINHIRKSRHLWQFLDTMFQQNRNRKSCRILANDLIMLENKLAKKSENQHLVDYLAVHNLDRIILTIKQLGEEIQVDGHVVFRYPSRVQRLVRAVDKLARFMKTFYIKHIKEELLAEITKFLEIYEEESKKILSKEIYQSKKMQSQNNDKRLPKTSDVIKLNNMLKEETQNLVNKFKKKSSFVVWKKLLENILCRLTIFNRRRGGAVEKMRVDDYKKAKVRNVMDNTEESIYQLKEEEIEFLTGLKIVAVLHKCNNFVKIFITKEMMEVMDILLKFREEQGIGAANPYFFAAGKGSQNPLRFTKILEMYREMFPEGIKELFTATNLRKHGATTAQVLNMSSQDFEEWTTHMGHTPDVHKKYYRQREDVNSILKTGRILKALDEGTLKYFKGKKLEDIPFSSEVTPVQSKHRDHSTPSTSGLKSQSISQVKRALFESETRAESHEKKNHHRSSFKYSRRAESTDSSDLKGKILTPFESGTCAESRKKKNHHRSGFKYSRRTESTDSSDSQGKILTPFKSGTCAESRKKKKNHHRGGFKYSRRAESTDSSDSEGKILTPFESGICAESRKKKTNHHRGSFKYSRRAESTDSSDSQGKILTPFESGTCAESLKKKKNHHRGSFKYSRRAESTDSSDSEDEREKFKKRTKHRTKRKKSCAGSCCMALLKQYKKAQGLSRLSHRSSRRYKESKKFLAARKHYDTSSSSRESDSDEVYS